MSDLGQGHPEREPDEPEREGPPLVGAGGEDISGGIIVSGTGGRRLDDDGEPGHSDLDEVVEGGRRQGWGRGTSGTSDEAS